MVKSSRGMLSRRTRKLKGKSIVSVAQYVRTFNIGDKVLITPKAKREGLPHLRYSNKHGIVVEQRGKSYVVEVDDYSKKKKVIAGSVHLRLAS
ncbi:hypothetical protein HY988_03535 [Candidatus Micrarchaeota archaeon]|nr:hypothetical protein [Candidatus Micrarchaeota archaeon]